MQIADLADDLTEVFEESIKRIRQLITHNLPDIP